MRCSDLELVGLLTGDISRDGLERALDHLQECDGCRAFYEILRQMRSDRAQVLRALKGRRAERGLEFGFLNKLDALPIHVAALMILAAALLIVYLAPRPPQTLAELATNEPYPFESMTLRGHIGSPEDEALFFEAMDEYLASRYDRAQSKLRFYLDRRPYDAEARFYLGVCCYLSGQTEEAIYELQAAADLDKSKRSEKCRWYLAHCHLKLGNRAEALAELEAVIRHNGDYAAEASELIEAVSLVSNPEGR